ncbi:MAG: NADP-dependent oxidoreductase [Acidobacteriaceae bacterium]
MKAIRLHARGGPEQLVYEDAPQPTLAAGDALVRIFATGITRTELTWDQTYQNPDGSPRLPTIPGHEFSGIVESLPPGGDGLAIGDAVYGLADFPRNGAAAEYLAVRATHLAHKPRTVDHVRSSAVTLSGLTAWQALFTHGNLLPGQSVLIHGGAGGVGVFAVQLAHWKGAHVIATSSAANFDFLRSLGADEVINYTKTRFEAQVSKVDLVLDAVGGDTVDRSWQLLRPNGMLISIATSISPGEPKKHGARGLFFIVEPSRDQLDQLATLVDSGILKIEIANVFPLAQARAAFEEGLKEHTRGKIVLQVRDEASTI